MNAKEKYQAAYREWRLFFQEVLSKPEKARAKMWDRKYDTLTLAYGHRETMKAERSLMQRDNPTYEGGYKQESRRYWWKRDRKLASHYRLPKSRLCHVIGKVA